MSGATASGDHAIAVAVDGDSNVVTILAGGSRLLIEKRHHRAAAPTTPIEILLTERQASTLLGRGPDLAALAAWRDAAAIVAVRCITGRGGSGKTRLAIEACAAAEKAGWSAGFVTSEELARFHQSQNLASWALPKPVLLVIDYAATSLPVLKSWFAAVARNPTPRGAKLRILLLERHADADAGWWADLLRRESRSAGPADLIGNQLPHQLPPLDSIEDRRALLAEAMGLAAPLLDPPRPVLAPPPLGADPAFDAQLSSNRIDNEPLYLLMAGIHAAQHGAPAALALGRDELADAMASIETARIAARAAAWGHADGGALLQHLAACLSLQNGTDLADLLELVTAEAAAMALALPAAAERVAEQLCEVLPQLADRIEPVRPDLIGEAFLLRHVTGGRIRSDAVRAGIISRAWHRAPTSVVDSLVRTAQDFAAGSADHRAVQWLSGIVAQLTDLDDLIRVSNGLPDQTLALRELALAILQRIVVIVRNAESMEEALGAALTNIANRLSALGQREAALAAAQEAVTLRRILAAARPDTFTPELAGSLNNLANRRFELGQREAALAAAQEALTLWRKLAAARPDAFTPDLSGSLNNLASCLSALGEREAALHAAQEGVMLCRSLAAAQPDVFTPDLARSLNNLASFLSSLGQREAALDAALEALALRRGLVATRPDAFLPDLSASLNNLSNYLAALGQREAALEAVQEAVALRRKLAAARPDAFTPDLSGSLNNLSNRLSDLGQHENALDAAEQAVTLRRGLATVRPDAFTPDLAKSLINLANRRYAVGQHEAALYAAQEAVTLYRMLASVRPDVFTPELAGSLNNLANILLALGQTEAAPGAAQEAVAQYRMLAAAQPDAFTPDLAASLSNLAGHLSALGQLAAALDAAQEAVTLYRRLAAARPDAFTPNLATSLSVLGDMMEGVGRIADAVPTDREACALLLPLCAAFPDAFAGQLQLYARDYVRRAEAAGIPIDDDLVALAFSRTSAI